MNAAAYEPVLVHITGSDVAMGHAAPRRKRSSLYDTITLTSAEAAENLLPASENRKIAFVAGLDQAIVIGPSKSGVAQGIGTIIPQNVVWPVEDDEAVFVAPTPALTGTTTARVSVNAVYEDE